MVGSRWHGVVLVVGMLATACSPAAPRLSVDVITDLSPWAEFTSVHTTLDARGIDHVPLVSDRWLHGVRVAELDGLSVGGHTLDVALLSGTRLVATRRVALSLSGDLAVTVVVARSCVGIACPGVGDPASATTCVDGRCASPACGTAGAAACPGCMADTECGASSVACAPTRCMSGTCLRAPDDARCSAGLVCDVAAGCVAPTDGGGPLDAETSDLGTGTDAGLAPDASVEDLGVDASAEDLGVDASADLGADAGPNGPCSTCLRDSDCAAGSLCFSDPFEAGERDCYPTGGVCPASVYIYPVDAFSIDGTHTTACTPPDACTVIRAYGTPCTTSAMCGRGHGDCVGSPSRCTYVCMQPADCSTGTCSLSECL